MVINILKVYVTLAYENIVLVSHYLILLNTSENRHPLNKY